MAHATLANFAGAIEMRWGDGVDATLPPDTETTTHAYLLPGIYTITAEDANGQIATTEFVARVAWDRPDFELTNAELVVTATLTHAPHVPVTILWE